MTNSVHLQHEAIDAGLPVILADGAMIQRYPNGLYVYRPKVFTSALWDTLTSYDLDELLLAVLLNDSSLYDTTMLPVTGKERPYERRIYPRAILDRGEC